MRKSDDLPIKKKKKTRKWQKMVILQFAKR